MNKAIFLDKDQTLIKDIPYNVKPELVELMPTVGEGLRLLQDAGYKLVIVSNQAGVALGKFSVKDVYPLWQKLTQLLKPFHVNLDAVYYCPHHPQGTIEPFGTACGCRKPRPGMLLRGARELKLSLKHSWILGDILTDVEAGHRAGCRAIQVDTGGEREWDYNTLNHPEFVTPSFMDAAKKVLELDGFRKGKTAYDRSDQTY